MIVYMDIKKLKGRILSHGDNITTIAKRLGVCYETARLKVNGKNEFTLNELIILKNYLNLNETEFIDIFLKNNRTNERNFKHLFNI